MPRQVPDPPPFDAMVHPQVQDFFIPPPLAAPFEGILVSCQVLPFAGAFGLVGFFIGRSYFLDFSPSQAHALRDKRRGLFGSLAASGWSRI